MAASSFGVGNLNAGEPCPFVAGKDQATRAGTLGHGSTAQIAGLTELDGQLLETNAQPQHKRTSQARGVQRENDAARASTAANLH